MEAAEVEASVLSLVDVDISEVRECSGIEGVVAVEHENEIGFVVKSVSNEEFEILHRFGRLEVGVEY